MPALRRTISLDHLESQVPEGIFAAAERYIQEGRVDQLRELDKNLWQARISGFDQLIEPEVLLRGNNVKAFSCECSKGAKRVPCAHLTALLLMIRKIRKQKLEKQVTVSPPEFKTRDLIGLLPESSLRKFIREWAERDPELELALRAEFFHLPVSSNHEAYLQKLFQGFLLEDGSLCTEPAAALRSLQVLIRHLIRQCDSLLESGDDPRAYHTMSFILRHLSRSSGVRNRTALGKQILLLVSKQADREALDPSSTRFDFLLENMPYFLVIDEEKLFPQVLIELQAYAGFAQATTRINTAAGELLKTARQSIQYPQALLLVYYQTLDPHAKQGPWIESLGLPRLPPSVYANLASTLLDSGDFEGALTLAGKGLHFYPLYAELLRIQVMGLWESHNFSLISELLERLLTIHLVPEDLDLARNFLPPEAWASFCLDLSGKLRAQPSSFERNVLLCEALFQTGERQALEDVIVFSESPKIMHRFFDRLLGQSPDRIGEVLERFLKQYLSKHIGPPATTTVAYLIDLLSHQQSSNERQRILRFLREHFPERLELQFGGKTKERIES